MDIIQHAIEVSGADLYVEERGTGEPLVLLHGMTGTSGDWRFVFDLEALARPLGSSTRRSSDEERRSHGVVLQVKMALAFRV
jgi:pimeloyl-ACP methyl ester carboxylesterase